MTLNPKDSGKIIAELSTFVKIKKDGITKLGDEIVEEIDSGRLTPGNFSQVDVHPNSNDPWALDWLFIVDTLNFCFWHHEHEEGWKVEGYTGYFALCAAINRALKENVDILNPNFYSTITEAQLRKILRSDTKVDVPLLSERIACLHEVGHVLLEKFDGSFKNVVKQADNSAENLLNLIVNNFKCFKDEADYKGHKVAIYKRAQILVGDIWACFKNKDIGHFKDIEVISMFADYRVPQTLLWYNILEYSEELVKKLKDNVILKNGEEMEIEIRGCSIHAVELINEYVSNKLKVKKINSILIDHFLWDFRRKHAKEILEKGLPFHKVFSIYY
ncbi:queuosine salvage protein [Aethina tumida]|uniref:queuosine salvage protein n=1 Tax=Aethina tumida TaxID=116153 RepID=UPI002147CB99|nr:queuosine salvage protein [Aethina tumida]